jgi:hypothetical protein
MFARKIPASTVLIDGQLMAGDMPLEHLAAPAAFQADHVVPMSGSPDRDGGRQFGSGFGCRFSEANERPMHGRDQGRQLVGCYLVSPNVSGDDIGRQFSIERCRRLFVGHFGSPCSNQHNTMPRQIATTGSPFSGLAPVHSTGGSSAMAPYNFDDRIIKWNKLRSDAPG